MHRCLSLIHTVKLLVRLLPFIACGYFGLGQGGCITPAQQEENNRRASFQSFLSGQIGIMTYDDAIMRWGRPLSKVDGDNIFLATWGDQRTGAVAIPLGNGIVAAPVNHGWKLELAFEKETKLLRNWRMNEW